MAVIYHARAAAHRPAQRTRHGAQLRAFMDRTWAVTYASCQYRAMDHKSFPLVALPRAACHCLRESWGIVNELNMHIQIHDVHVARAVLRRCIQYRSTH